MLALLAGSAPGTGAAPAVAQSEPPIKAGLGAIKTEIESVKKELKAIDDLRFRSRKALQVEQLKAHAQGPGGIAMAAVEAWLASDRYSAEVQKDCEAGSAAGLRGTPGFFIGKPAPDGSFDGTFIRGAQPIQVFRDAVEHPLEEG